ncbi:hypothetical protein O4J56_06740 [Nocardiopsis sp. RSe5-2]|uniref:Uncharacterized protein n=1 Tax=Nocardiopsis endophytica TaxID=3018445 RepID=A0ABT4U075_9ACTN|nr:hypothetical protein [Nocardiopsis endophytica]MDA2810331.1 hypothetical protein [Nocardiopsis endophytica]
MIPQLVTVRRRRSDGRWRTLHVPVVPVAVVLAPLLLIGVLAGAAVCLAHRVGPARALAAAGRVLWALPGTRFEVEEGGGAFHVSIR